MTKEKEIKKLETKIRQLDKKRNGFLGSVRANRLVAETYECVEKILELDENNIKALEKIVYMLTRDKREEEVEKYFEKLLAIDENNIVAKSLMNTHKARYTTNATIESLQEANLLEEPKDGFFGNDNINDRAKDIVIDAIKNFIHSFELCKDSTFMTITEKTLYRERILKSTNKLIYLLFIENLDTLVDQTLEKTLNFVENDIKAIKNKIKIYITRKYITSDIDKHCYI